MILVAGGQFDINIRVLFNQLLRRNVSFHHLLVGHDQAPRLRIDLRTNIFELDGEAISPTACFIRHDVFLYQNPNATMARASAVNWYQAVRGWTVSQPSIRLFNRYSHLRENNKIQNLLLAQESGLSVPDTIVTNDFADFGALAATLIQKPVAGGEYTRLLSDLQHELQPSPSYPRFVQTRLRRPEMRIYRIGPTMIAFLLRSSEIDYRRTQKVEITPTSVPAAIGEKLMLLCDRLELDFAAADFMEDEGGELRFLEVNSQPMFAAFDQVVEGQLCDAIIDYLSEGTV